MIKYMVYLRSKGDFKVLLYSENFFLFNNPGYVYVNIYSLSYS